MILAGAELLGARQGLTQEDMIATVRVGHVAVSPDGAHVVYRVQHFSYDHAGPHSVLWLTRDPAE
jgi:hypothetical protein